MLWGLRFVRDHDKQKNVKQRNVGYNNFVRPSLSPRHSLASLYSLSEDNIKEIIVQTEIIKTSFVR